MNPADRISERLLTITKLFRERGELSFGDIVAEGLYRDTAAGRKLWCVDRRRLAADGLPFHVRPGSYKPGTRAVFVYGTERVTPLAQARQLMILELGKRQQGVRLRDCVERGFYVGNDKDNCKFFQRDRRRLKDKGVRVERVDDQKNNSSATYATLGEPLTGEGRPNLMVTAYKALATIRAGNVWVGDCEDHASTVYQVFASIDPEIIPEVRTIMRHGKYITKG